MSLNRSVPQPINKTLIYQQTTKSPDYDGLVRFLLQPFLESPDSLSVDCEIFPNRSKVWIRVAFEGEDKGRVFGRAGRNIQAIRTVIAAAAAAVGQSVYLDIYGGQVHSAIAEDPEAGQEEPKKSTPRREIPKPAIKSRSSSK